MINKYCRSRRKDIIRYVLEISYRLEYWFLDDVKRDYRIIKARRLPEKAAKLRSRAVRYAKAIARGLPEVGDLEKKSLLEEMLRVLDEVEGYFSYMEYTWESIVRTIGKDVNMFRRRINRLEKLLDFTRFEHCWCIRIPEVLTVDGYVKDMEKFEKMGKLIKTYMRGFISVEDFELLLMGILRNGELGRYEFIPINKALNLDEAVLKEIYIRNIIREFEKMYCQLSEREVWRLRKRLSRYPAIRLEAFWYSVEYFRLSGSEFVRRFLTSEFLSKL